MDPGAQFLAPAYVQEAAHTILVNMVGVFERISGQTVDVARIKPKCYRVYQGRKQGFFNKHPLLRGLSSRDGIDLPAYSFALNKSDNYFALATKTHELAHVILNCDPDNRFAPQKQKEFETQTLAACTEFEMNLAGLWTLIAELIKAPETLVPFATTAFKTHFMNGYALGHLNGMAMNKATDMYGDLQKILERALSEKHDTEVAQNIVATMHKWKPVKTYKQALRQYDKLARGLVHLQDV